MQNPAGICHLPVDGPNVQRQKRLELGSDASPLVRLEEMTKPSMAPARTMIHISKPMSIEHRLTQPLWLPSTFWVPLGFSCTSWFLLMTSWCGMKANLRSVSCPPCFGSAPKGSVQGAPWFEDMDLTKRPAAFANSLNPPSEGTWSR